MSGGAAASYRRARTIRSAITLIFLTAVLAGAAWFGWQEVLGESEPDSTLVCETPGPGDTQKVAAADVTVNVYNAGGTPGLADETADALEARGFTVDLVANASDEAADVTYVEINGRAEDAPEVQMLAAQVIDDAGIVPDDRLETDVDLVLGDEFDGLVEDGPSAMEVESTVPICTTRTPEEGEAPADEDEVVEDVEAPPEEQAPPDDDEAGDNEAGDNEAGDNEE